MSRKRYLSTDISTDARVRQLAEKSEFAALLYTWMVPHAADDATLVADPDELLMLVVPGFRWRTAADVTEAVELMIGLGLVDRDGEQLRFPAKAFYGYQSYIGTDRRPESAKPRESSQNGAHVCTGAGVPVVSSSFSSSYVAPLGATPSPKSTKSKERGPSAATPRAAPPNEPLTEPEPTVLHADGQVCPGCRLPFVGSYGDHLETAPGHKIRAVPEDFKGRKRANGHAAPEVPPEVAERLGAPPLVTLATPEDLVAEHERLLARERSVRQVANAPPAAIAEPPQPDIAAPASAELAVQARGSP